MAPSVTFESPFEEEIKLVMLHCFAYDAGNKEKTLGEKSARTKNGKWEKQVIPGWKI